MENLPLDQLTAFQWGGNAVTVPSHDKHGGLGPVYDDVTLRPGYTAHVNPVK